ncbi:uncharacterized protein Bfra_006749 [Botrytis fragariae]|uniref:Uncharacterized protein n=1 Tax=Botrytis fragariae TaxID=1964551 RepID=A0A8H6EPL0_9HELO|nr:uncharacterized protein Bfra_006749 [Botrytis fragariae]KAF5879540.1 hypothetical protein Bfra_006749 [Botrytis fragariae]
MSRLLLRTPRLTASALGLTSYTSYTLLQSHRFPARLDSVSSPLSKNGNAPIIKKGAAWIRRLTPTNTKPTTGLGAGLAVSTFSRSLALIIGLMVVGIQWASSHGLDIVPTDRIQRYIKHVNLRSLVEENVAFKVSFGTTFAMAAFMRF